MSHKYKAWDEEIAFTLLRALELRISPVGYHVAMPHRVKRGEDLTLVVYQDGTPRPITKRDRASIVSLLQATEMHLVSMDALEKTTVIAGCAFKRAETWVYGRGKNLRKVKLFMMEP